jgi:hypothetical protein
MHVSHEALRRGHTVNTLSTQWANRPADQRFLSLDELYTATRRMRDAPSASAATASVWPEGPQPSKRTAGTAASAGFSSSK